MNGPSVLPTPREQAHHVLTLLGAPAAARLAVDVHGALFDSDLSTGGLGGLLRDEARTYGTPRSVPPGEPRCHLCCGLDAARLTPAPGLVALSTWPLAVRLVTPVSLRVNALTMVVRIAEFAAVRPGASRATEQLLRRLAADVPGGPEAHDVLRPGVLAEAARAALAAPRLANAAAADRAVREAAAVRAESLDEHQRLFGLSPVPRQSSRRGGHP